MVRILWLVAFAPLILCNSCGRAPDTGARRPASASPGTNLQIFQAQGVVKAIKPDGKTVEIRHNEITNYMPAMTMPFEAKDPKELAGLKPGDAVAFRLSVTEKDEWIDQIRKLTNTLAFPGATGQSASNLSGLPTSGPFRVVRDVEPLQIGDPLPEYHFTNELGQPISTAQFKGQALAITFIFTRCPLPNFCPRMSSSFADVQKALLAQANGPTNWHLLTISFDPEFDTPAVLRTYAQRFGADPAHWNFLTGDLIEITAISEQFGQMFWRDETGSISHNLRTAVVDASGRVRKIYEGNNWTSEELAAELVAWAGK
jgi:protein SCO1/2